LSGNDGNTNPIVLIADESGRKYNYVSRQIADAIEAKDEKCACVVGNVAIWTATNPTFVYFTSVSKVTSRDEQKCSEQGL